MVGCWLERWVHRVVASSCFVEIFLTMGGLRCLGLEEYLKY